MRGRCVVSSRRWFAAVVAGAMFGIPSAASRLLPVATEGVLGQLGLTEAQARTLLFEEMKSDTAGHRRTAIAVTGHRAFYRLPAAARGPAAAALFAWAKAYVASPGFRTTYAQFRRDANPLDTRADTPAEEHASSKVAELLAAIDDARKAAATMPPAERERFLAQLEAQEAQLLDPKLAGTLESALESERAERAGRERAAALDFEERFPADPNRIVARRLRRFLDDTADADFDARLIRLTDGPDGMEFIDPAHRAKSPTWQLAVLAGADATRAARASAEAWLKEIEP